MASRPRGARPAPPPPTSPLHRAFSTRAAAPEARSRARPRKAPQGGRGRNPPPLNPPHPTLPPRAVPPAPTHTPHHTSRSYLHVRDMAPRTSPARAGKIAGSTTRTRCRTPPPPLHPPTLPCGGGSHRGHGARGRGGSHGRRCRRGQRASDDAGGGGGDRTHLPSSPAALLGECW